MAVTYKNLFHLLIDRGIPTAELTEKAGFSANILTRLRRDPVCILDSMYFTNYHIFGFTGTPIFSANAAAGGNPDLRTTEQAFGDKLHTYTIVDAINDRNVLPFRIDYINTVRQKDSDRDKKVTAIDTEEALSSQERISEVVKYILEHFDQKTMRNSYYSLKGQRVNGFNSMFAVSSIPVCKKYYLELKKQISRRHRELTIATIFPLRPMRQTQGWYSA